MNERPDTIALAEQRVAEARTAVIADYRSVRANLNRRARSPAVVGGVLLGALALGYVAVRRRKPERAVGPRGAGRWSLALNTLQLLLPLLTVLGARTRTARRPGGEAGAAKR
ncbi:MAG: hypothetical protein WC830_11335 [Burkholderiales bacterium]|jgi:hypothetical protein